MQFSEAIFIISRPFLDSMSRKEVGIGLAFSAVLGATLACSRADVPLPPVGEEAPAVVRIVESYGQEQSPTPFIPPSATPADIPTEIPTEIPEPTPISAPNPTPTPTAAEVPLPEIVLEWQEICSAPGQCAQALLDSGWTYYENDKALYGRSDFGAGPALSLSKMAGDCEDVVMAIAAGLLDDGYAPLALIVATDDYVPNNHIVYPYRENSLWGYVSVTNYDGKGSFVGTHVVDIKPQFGSIQELFSSYQDRHPWAHPYTRYYLVDLDSVPDWLRTTEQLEFRYAIADNDDNTDVPAEPGLDG